MAKQSRAVSEAVSEAAASPRTSPVTVGSPASHRGGRPGVLSTPTSARHSPRASRDHPASPASYVALAARCCAVSRRWLVALTHLSTMAVGRARCFMGARRRSVHVPSPAAATPASRASSGRRSVRSGASSARTRALRDARCRDSMSVVCGCACAPHCRVTCSASHG